MTGPDTYHAIPKRTVPLDSIRLTEGDASPTAQESAEALAALILETGETVPPLVREIRNPDPETAAEKPVIRQLVDGERRVRAYRYLLEQTGDPRWSTIECGCIGTDASASADPVPAVG